MTFASAATALRARALRRLVGARRHLDRADRRGAGDIPNVAEKGFPGFAAVAWFGLLPGTPPAVVERAHRAAVAALRAPEL